MSQKPPRQTGGNRRVVPAIEVHESVQIEDSTRRKVLRYGYYVLKRLPTKEVSPVEMVAFLKFVLEMAIHQCAEQGVPSQALKSAQLAGQALAEAECAQYYASSKPVN